MKKMTSDRTDGHDLDPGNIHHQGSRGRFKGRFIADKGQVTSLEGGDFGVMVMN